MPEPFDAAAYARNRVEMQGRWVGVEGAEERMLVMCRTLEGRPNLEKWKEVGGLVAGVMEEGVGRMDVGMVEGERGWEGVRVGMSRGEWEGRLVDDDGVGEAEEAKEGGAKTEGWEVVREEMKVLGMLKLEVDVRQMTHYPGVDMSGDVGRCFKRVLELTKDRVWCERVAVKCKPGQNPKFPYM